MKSQVQYRHIVKHDIIHFAGFEGIICGGSAIYLAMAEVLNEQYGRTILPIGAAKGATH